MVIDEDCRGFLTRIATHSYCDQSYEDTPQVLYISIVRNSVHVLSEDLLGLPLDIEIEFIIELLLSTASSSTASYCVILTG